MTLAEVLARLMQGQPAPEEAPGQSLRDVINAAQVKRSGVQRPATPAPLVGGVRG